MAINLSDLPPKYQQQAMEKYRKQQTRRGPMPSAADVQDPGKPMKYRNNPTERVTSSGAVIRFDSQKEARRYDHLILRQQAGEICASRWILLCKRHTRTRRGGGSALSDTGRILHTRSGTGAWWWRM